MFLDYLVKYTHQSIYRYKEVLEYLKSRNLTDAEIHEFEIGFNKVISIPAHDDEDYFRFLDKTYKGRKLEEKIIFPLKDALGNNVGLIGRSIKKKEFEIYVTKRGKFEGFFFGLDKALPFIYRENKVYVVEGPFDFFALRKALPNVVAALTAGISENQYNYLRFFCDNIVLVLDSDKAGKIGTDKAMKNLNKGIYSMELGFKDSAKTLEVLGIDKFKSYVLKRVPVIF
jgi:DNA primase